MCDFSRASAGSPCSLIFASVISASGVPWSCDGSGVADGFGVGNGGGRSGVTEARVLLGAGTLLLFRGEGFFVGETGSGGMLSDGSKICDGSVVSPVFVLLLLAALWGVGGAPVVFRLVCRRGVRAGAGVKSSSLSSG